MRLKSIELQGFKSFLDRTVLHFDEGITAILGPNGCGKSNIVDAVRWVLGEQSAKSLRGGKMDDVIFKGTTKRRPVGMAEVTLVFDNEDRGLPIEFSEVAIKRKVTRDGGSDYFLNGSLCRLKDLRDLFYDSGVNNTSYSIIEESMIKQILNENNTELRTLLEEGSGITKYKARRKETQRKLDRAQSDLIRLYDIIEEIGREVRSLQRQVGKARRHQKLFKEIRALDLLVAGKRRADMDGREAEAREKLEQFRTMAEAGVGELTELQVGIETARPQIDEREAERRQLEQALLAFEGELQNTERQVVLLEHRIDEHERRIKDNIDGSEEAARRQKEIEGQIEQLGASLVSSKEQLKISENELSEGSEALDILMLQLDTQRTALDDATSNNLEFIESDALKRSQLRELQIRQENRRERIDTLAQEQENILAEAEQAESTQGEMTRRLEDLTAGRNELLELLAGNERQETELEVLADDLQEKFSALLARREAARSTCELLQRLQDDYDGYGQGSREVLKRHGGEDRVTGGLADQLQVSPSDLGALEILLAELLDAVVVDGCATAIDLVQELRNEEIGQASFLCSGGFSAQTATVALSDLPGGRPALEVITGAGTEIPALQNLLARAKIYDTDDEAAAAAAGYQGTGAAICVSRQGLLVSCEGKVRGGKGKAADSNLLGRKARLDELAAELENLEHRLVTAQEQTAANKTERENLREGLLSGRSRLNQLDDETGQVQVEIARVKHQRETAAVRVKELESERVRLTDEAAALAAQEEQMTDLLAESGRQRQDSTLRRDELRKLVTEAEMTRDQARAEVEEWRLSNQRHQSQMRETDSALEHLRQNVAEQFTRRERLAQDNEVAREAVTALSQELAEKREHLGKAIEERERRRQVVRAAAEGIQVLHEEVAGWHVRVQDIEKQRGGFRDQAHEMETLLATLDIQRINLEERIEEQYKGAFATLLTSVEPEDIPRELEMDEGVFQAEQAAELLEAKRGKISSLGPINHLALEEYEIKKERLEFLEGQRDDVEKARDDLTNAITEINRTARKRFLQTFEEVRRNYMAVFQTLFKGGRADLQLIKTEDPLESNLQVLAQPTGKIIDNVSLLSGGERCLTALSLLFAVYLVKPSPFCMLDEADAPLDDVNIGRFVNMLREFSNNTQFLVITHNKLTMETANHLYGVTMMEPGISNIVSVSFHDVADTRSDKELSEAIADRRQEIDRSEASVDAMEAHE